ncbi:unnamed protein product [Rangifer tarandus platyrhynchus]|uniref:Uncharacterized protein n=2 Tax=Rangifer tarandus platyrhynchus TaxID=3082113 RepID=A0ABN8XVR6_RANTA|nr:unnamed protein product [Rangifer tarandus platyrhynchus]
MTNAMSCNCHIEQVSLMASHSWNNQETTFTNHSAGKISSISLDENMTVLFFSLTIQNSLFILSHKILFMLNNELLLLLFSNMSSNKPQTSLFHLDLELLLVSLLQ